jgi:hypothetical protein
MNGRIIPDTLMNTRLFQIEASARQFTINNCMLEGQVSTTYFSTAKLEFDFRGRIICCGLSSHECEL